MNMIKIILFIYAILFIIYLILFILYIIQLFQKKWGNKNE